MQANFSYIGRFMTWSSFNLLRILVEVWTFPIFVSVFSQKVLMLDGEDMGICKGELMNLSSDMKFEVAEKIGVHWQNVSTRKANCENLAWSAALVLSIYN